MNFMQLFQGLGTLFEQEPSIAVARIVLIALGIVLIWLSSKHILEPLIMAPMGFGLIAVNAGMLFNFPVIIENDPNNVVNLSNILVSPAESTTSGLMSILQIDAFQPIYSFTFSNGLIACMVFLGIGAITDISPVLRYPFTSMLIALFAELGTILIFPIAIAWGFDPGAAASLSIIGGADGPMVLFASLVLAPDFFVPLTIVAYVYLSICYGVYPFLIRLLIPKELRGKAVQIQREENKQISTKAKLMFDVIACLILCLLFPVAAPLFLSFFLGNGLKELLMKNYIELMEKVFLYTATFFLGLMLGLLCDAKMIIGDERVAKLLVLGFLALFIAAIGGIIGGYVVYLINKKNFNPAIGVAGVSCVPTTAKVVHEVVMEANKKTFILHYAMGASVCGVITSAILTGIYVTVILPYVS